MSTPYSPSGSLEEAKGHAHGIVNVTVGRHPTTSLALIVILVLLLIFFWHDASQWKSAAKAGRTTKKASFGVAPYNNLNMGGNNPMWYLGSDHAGWGGDLMRDSTVYHVAEYTPDWRAGAVAPAPREGMTSARGPRAAGPSGAGAGSGGYGPCGPFQTAVTVHNPDGSMVTRCHNDATGPAQACGGWSPAASVEATALATVGGIKHAPQADRKLQRAVNAAYDTTDGLSDEQLERLMHQGGTP